MFIPNWVIEIILFTVGLIIGFIVELKEGLEDNSHMIKE